MTPSGLEEKSARPSAWVVRAGASGEFAEEFLSHQIVAIGFSPTGNVAGMTRDEVTRAVSSWGRSPQGARMLFEFASEIKIGDLIITPAPGAESALVGSVGGDYEYAEDPPIDDLHHSRKMRWRGWVSTGTLEASSVNNLKLRPTLYKPGEQEKLLGLAELPLVRGNPTSPDAMTFHDNIWLEITDRNNIGTDLTGGQRRQDGGTSSHYSLAKTIRPGDLVFHWDKRRGAIVGRSFTEGQLEEVGEHWLFPLRGYVELERPVTLAKLRAKEQEIREIHRRHKQASPDKLFFPFQLSDTRPLRPAEQYLARFPLEIVDIFEELANIPVRPLNISDLLENALELL